MWFGEVPPRIRPSGLFQVAQNFLQRRRRFYEPLVAHRRSVDKRLGLPCGAFVMSGSERVGGAKKNPSGYAPYSSVGESLTIAQAYLLLYSSQKLWHVTSPAALRKHEK